MPLPPADVIEIAKSYAYQTVVRDKTPAEATDYIRRYYPAVTQEQLDMARHQAELGIEVGERLTHMSADAHLRDALEGYALPDERVGVRVHIYRNMASGEVRHNSVYLDMRWDQTKSDIDRAAAQFVQSLAGESREVESWAYQFEGPTLWPVQRS